VGQNSGPVGKRHKRAYYELQRAGVQEALSRGLLFGRRVEKTSKRVIIPDRGKVIWPDPPKGMMRQWWRAHQTGHFLGEPIPQ
jgi:hypothetical protein